MTEAAIGLSRTAGAQAPTEALPGGGHNSRLAVLAEDARKGLARVAAGEADAIEDWRAYSAALDVGRTLFPSDERFGQWVAEVGLSQLGTHEVKRDDRAAAMWAAANPEQFAEKPELTFGQCFDMLTAKAAA